MSPVSQSCTFGVHCLPHFRALRWAALAHDDQNVVQRLAIHAHPHHGYLWRFPFAPLLHSDLSQPRRNPHRSPILASTVSYR